MSIRQDKIGRREFLGKASLAALTVPAFLHRGSKISYAASGSLAGDTQVNKRNVKIICIEEHWRNNDVDEITNKWRARTGYPPVIDPKSTPLVGPRIKDFEQFRLPIMDELGITTQVLTTTSPGIQGVEDASTAVVMAKKINDALAEITNKYRGRFAAYAALPTQDPKSAANELERAVTQLGLKGAMIFGHTNGEYLDGQKFWVLWECTEALGVPIYLHPAELPLRARTSYEGHPELLGPMWGWVVETATHALRIVGNGVFDAFPKATLILGHLGESLPYLLGRLDEGYAGSFRAKNLKKLPSEYVKQNIVITTSGEYQPEAMVCAVKALGSDRILFAADYPYAEPKVAIEELERTPLSDSDKEKIYHLNAERLLKL
jgi:2,3-dihydroxybenzoate decarboxylase